MEAFRLRRPIISFTWESVRCALGLSLSYEHTYLKAHCSRFTQILMNSNNTFELQTLAMVNREFARDQMSTGTVLIRVYVHCLSFLSGACVCARVALERLRVDEIQKMKLERDPRFLVLRGQMMYMTVWDSILFLCTPVYAYVWCPTR